MTDPTGTYPVDARLARLGPADHVFLFLTWHRIGFHPERLQQYSHFPCKACRALTLPLVAC